MSLGRVNMAEITTLLGLRGSWSWGGDGCTPLKLAYLKDQLIFNEQLGKKKESLSVFIMLLISILSLYIVFLLLLLVNTEIFLFLFIICY